MEVQWSLVLFTVLTGMAGWGFAALALEEIRGKGGKSGFFVAIVMLIALIVGGCISVTHLSHPENMLGALSHPTSGIFVEALLVGLTAASAGAYLVVKWRDGAASAVRILAVLAGVFGIVLSFMAGESYTMSSQPAWNTVLVPIGYCLTVAPAGVAFYLVLAAAKGEEDDVKLLGSLLGAFGFLGALSALAWGAASGTLALVGTAIWVSVAGALAAALLGMLARSGKNVLVVAVIALACALIGAIAYRYGMWATGFGINNFFGMI